MISFFKKMTIPTIVLLWSIMYVVETSAYSNRDVLLIRPLFVLIAITYLIILFKEYIQSRIKDSRENVAFISAKEMKILLLMITYIFVIKYLGFVLTSFLSMLAMLYILEVRKIQHLLIFSSVSTVVLYIAFKVVLMVPLPSGLLGI